MKRKFHNPIYYLVLLGAFLWGIEIFPIVMPQANAKESAAKETTASNLSNNLEKSKEKNYEMPSVVKEVLSEKKDVVPLPDEKAVMEGIHKNINSSMEKGEELIKLTRDKKAENNQDD